MSIHSPGSSHDKKKNGFDEFEIESAARTLRESNEIRLEPELHKLALKHLDKEKHAIEHALKENAIVDKADKQLKKTFGDK